MKRLQFCLAVFAVLLALALSAFAQVEFGQFTGGVFDPTGAAVANAKVTVTNPGTDQTFKATTNSSGNYTVREVPPGVYRITVEAAGFKSVSNNGVTANAGTISHVDFKMQIGKASEVVEVTAEAAAVNTEDSKLSTTVTATQIANLPLNGRNVYDLIQLAPGAVNVTGVDFENGHNTVVNGVREDFNGFMINGISNKDLSGGVVNVPIEDTVAEFQQLELNVSAQYGSSAGSINNLVTKSGTNAIHGSAWDYLRNDALDANEFFLNQTGTARPPLHFNQAGLTVGGPIIKDKLFFFGSYQHDHFISSGTPQTLTVESAAWREAVTSAAQLPGAYDSVASLLYSPSNKGGFPPAIPGNPNSANAVTLASYVTPGVTLSNPTPTPEQGFAEYLCNTWVGYGNTSFGNTIVPRLAPILGVTATDIATMATLPGLGLATGACNTALTPAQAGTFGAASGLGRNDVFENPTTAIFGTQTQALGNLFNGNEASGRIDYNFNNNNRMFAQFNWLKETDSFGPCYSYCTRGFTNPAKDYFPTGQLSFVHTFSATVLNEFRVGYTQNNTGTTPNVPGVPSVSFGDGVAAFGSYNGYPQFFKDHEYSYGDMVSISHGNHSFKVGADLRRNIENSQFNVGRPSYIFNNPLYFAADSPGAEIAGVNPDFTNGGTGNAELDTNVRHWRNWEVGAYFQDDWKMSKRLTLNLGLRWDFYKRHTEQDNLATTFLLGSGSNIVQQLANANVPLGATVLTGPNAGQICAPALNGAPAPSAIVLAGQCGAGGFAAASSLGPNRYKDFGPRVGFAWDVFGDGKTSLRGGFGISYEGTLYNPLSNSRWNPPYYSFNLTSNALLPIFGSGGTVVYGPTTCGTTFGSCVPSGAAPTYTGPPTNPGQGTIAGNGDGATGNISGWAGFNPDTSYLSGIVLPKGIDDPYVYNYFLSVQREVAPKTVVEINYVGTAAHKLFRAEDINRAPGTLLPAGACVTDNLGRSLCGRADGLLENTPAGLTAMQQAAYANPASVNPVGILNPNYGKLRTWENVVNSNYNGLQAQVKKQMSHGILFNANYTYSHSIDNGSTWHSGATTANGAAGGEGYTTDQTLPGLDRGNSIYDIRHRLVLNYVIQLPGQNLKGALGAIAGGWSYNGIWSFQTGAHWQPYANVDDDPAALVQISNPSVACSANDVTAGNCENLGGNWNLDGGSSGRPNSSIQHITFNRNVWANGWCQGGFSFGSPCTGNQANLPVLSQPCLGCTGNLGRNNFVGPGQWYSDMTLAKTFTLTERFHLKFEANAFNIFNRPNFLLAVNGGGAHNSIQDPLLGAAAGTLNARNLQFGLKILF
jgi:carboxypeptidase family protein